MAWHWPPRFVFLLALWAAAAARGSHLDMCGVHPHLVPASQAPKCPAPPCATTEDTVSLALPVLLSLEHPSLAGQSGVAWGERLYLLGSAGAGRAVVEVGWDEARHEVILRGRTCGGHERNHYIPAVLHPGEHWLHLQVEAAGRQVTISHLKASGKVPAMTLTYQDDTPAMVAAVPRTRLGYSAVATVSGAAATGADDSGWYSWCDMTHRPLPESWALNCCSPPCVVTKATVTLALPFLLSLEEPKSRESLRNTKLHLLDNSGVPRGMVVLAWEGQDLAVWGFACGGQPVQKSVPGAALLPGEHWLHLLLEAKGRHVSLTLHSAVSYETVVIMTLTFQGDLPDTVEVVPDKRLGYSAAPTGLHWWRCDVQDFLKNPPFVLKLCLAVLSMTILIGFAAAR